MKERYPRHIYPDRYEAHVECNLFKAKNPTVIGFTTENDEDRVENDAVHISVVDFTQESLVPTYIISLKDRKDQEWAMEKFQLKDKFPCVTMWSEGVLVSQFNLKDLGTDIPWALCSYVRSLFGYVVTIGGKRQGGDIKAYRLSKLYEDLKELEGGESHG